MRHPLAKPLLLALGMALFAGNAIAASSHFDMGDLDGKIGACTNINDFVNSKWVAANPIPADRTRWGSFDKLREDSLAEQHTLGEVRRKMPARLRRIRSNRRSAG